jgi:hypothetical protein
MAEPQLDLTLRLDVAQWPADLGQNSHDSAADRPKFQRLSRDRARDLSPSL